MAATVVAAAVVTVGANVGTGDGGALDARVEVRNETPPIYPQGVPDRAKAAADRLCGRIDDVGSLLDGPGDPPAGRLEAEARGVAGAVVQLPAGVPLERALDIKEKTEIVLALLLSTEPGALSPDVATRVEADLRSAHAASVKLLVSLGYHAPPPVPVEDLLSKIEALERRLAESDDLKALVEIHAEVEGVVSATFGVEAAGKIDSREARALVHRVGSLLREAIEKVRDAPKPSVDARVNASAQAEGEASTGESGSAPDASPAQPSPSPAEASPAEAPTVIEEESPPAEAEPGPPASPPAAPPATPTPEPPAPAPAPAPSQPPASDPHGGGSGEEDEERAHVAVSVELGAPDGGGCVCKPAGGGGSAGMSARVTFG